MQLPSAAACARSGAHSSSTWDHMAGGSDRLQALGSEPWRGQPVLLAEQAVLKSLQQTVLTATSGSSCRSCTPRRPHDGALVTRTGRIAHRLPCRKGASQTLKSSSLRCICLKILSPRSNSLLLLCRPGHKDAITATALKCGVVLHLHACVSLNSDGKCSAYCIVSGARQENASQQTGSTSGVTPAA